MRSAPDTNQWLQQFLAGNDLAFKHYFDLHHEAIFYIAYKVVQDVQAAEDIVADSFQKLWEHRGNIQSEDHIAAFLKTVAKNRSLNYQKHIDVKTAYEEKLLLTSDGLDEADLERQLIQDELLKKLRKAVEELPPKCKEVFKELYYQGSSTKEASARLGISERNVLNQKAIALERLRGFFSG